MECLPWSPVTFAAMDIRYTRKWHRKWEVDQDSVRGGMFASHFPACSKGADVFTLDIAS